MFTVFMLHIFILHYFSNKLHKFSACWPRLESAEPIQQMNPCHYTPDALVGALWPRLFRQLWSLCPKKAGQRLQSLWSLWSLQMTPSKNLANQHWCRVQSEANLCILSS